MLSAGTPQITDPTQALKKSRIIWGALLLGEVLFLGVIIFVRGREGFPTGPNEMTWILVYIAFGLAIIMIPIGSLMRRIIMRRPAGQPVQPQAYLTATIVFNALFEATALFGLVVTLLHHNFFPAIIPTAIAMYVQLRNYPHGYEMMSVDIRFAPIAPS